MLLHHAITLCGREVKKKKCKKLKVNFFFNSTDEIKSDFYKF